MEFNKILKNIRPIIITLLGLTLIFLGLKFLIKETNFSYYSSLFSHLPDKIIVIRFCFSILLRIFLIITGIGIILRKDFFRKAFIIYGFFTMLTIYWKHPKSTFEKVYLSMIEDGTLDASFIESLPVFAQTSVVLNYIFDICLCGFFMLFLLRPGVKRLFK